jgi:hypothetical protein
VKDIRPSGGEFLTVNVVAEDSHRTRAESLELKPSAKA